MIVPTFERLPDLAVGEPFRFYSSRNWTNEDVAPNGMTVGDAEMRAASPLFGERLKVGFFANAA